MSFSTKFCSWYVIFIKWIHFLSRFFIVLVSDFRQQNWDGWRFRVFIYKCSGKNCWEYRQNNNKHVLREKLSKIQISEPELKSGNLNKSSEKFHKYSKKMEGTESKVEFKDIVKKQWILKQLESIGKFVLKNYWQSFDKIWSDFHLNFVI